MFKRGLMLNIKGSGHLEIILSFVFFVGFVFFIFLFLKPYDTKSMPESLMRGLADSFEKNTSTNLTTFFLEANYTSFPPNMSCFSINLSNEIDFFKMGFSNSFVENLSDNEVSSSLSSDGILKISKGLGNLNESYFKISISPEFEDEILDPSCMELDDYKIGSVLNRKVLSYNSLINLNKSYSDNYEGFKQDLGIPKVFDFAIVSKDLPEINMNRASPPSAEVFVCNYYFKVLKSNGNIINAEFTLKIW